MKPTPTQSNINSRARKLRIGLIVDSENSTKYVYELCEWGHSQTNLSITHLIIQKPPAAQKSTLARLVHSALQHGIQNLTRQVSFALLTKLEALSLSFTREHGDHLKKFNLSNFIECSVQITPIVSKAGLVYRYSDEDVTRIQDLELDVLIGCGSGILRGSILSSTRLGIISFHHADNRVNRGGPPGFWEVYSKQESTGFVIQQLSEELDGGTVLFRGCFRTRRSYLLNQACLYRKSNVYLRKILSDIAEHDSLPSPLDPFPYFNRLFKRPGVLQQCRYLGYLVFASAKKAIMKSLFRRDYRWGVAFSKTDWQSLVMWRSERIRNPANHFLADPFVISTEDGAYCFVEDYDYAIAKACIAVYRLDGKTPERLGVAISEPFHLSFPYLFQFESKLYMCPETSENRDIRIYECVKFPLEWRLKKVLMSDLSAVDSMIFERDGLWWLFTNIDLANSGDATAELFIYYADSPLADVWRPHPKNPIFVDSTRARNGGLLHANGAIYRVSQAQGFDLYGKRSTINKIIILNESEYLENAMISIEANFFPKLNGTHHLHSNGVYSAFDYVSWTQIG